MNASSKILATDLAVQDGFNDMGILFKIFSVLLLLGFLFYLLLPTPPFPLPPPDSVRSFEFADIESPLRRAYFTNHSREDVLAHYQIQFEHSPFLNIPLPTYRLNYPPEDAYALIRDQTRSTFLEEIVHPFRESVFVNGFQPSTEKDDIWYQEVHYKRKITIRYVPASPPVRVPLVFFSLIALLFILCELPDAVRSIVKND